MRFNIGDKVRFLNDVGGGKVVKYVDHETVLVLNDDDFEIPVMINELIPDGGHGYQNSGSETTQSSSNKNVQPKEELIEDDFVKEDDSIAIFLAFLPDNQQNMTDSSISIHLINDSNYIAFANVLFKYGALHVSHPQNIQSNTKAEIKSLAKNDINDVDSITVQLLFYKNEPHKLKQTISKEIKINPLKFFKQNTYSENDFFHEKAHLITVFDENAVVEEFPEINAEALKKAIQTKEYESKQLNKKTESKSSKPKEIREIDLHIHELLDNYENMSNQEIIDYQMEHFRKEIQVAIDENVKKLVFIHGKGNGVLKTELRRELKHKYRKHQFQDASFQQYGFGATMVYIN